MSKKLTEVRSRPNGKLLPPVPRKKGNGKNVDIVGTGGLEVAAEKRDVVDEIIIVLTNREREVMEMVLAGHPSKNIAADLGISQRTVENHRASIMRKTHARSLPELARVAFDACGCMRLERCPLHGEPIKKHDKV